MNQDLLYQIALTMVPQVGPVQAKILLQHFEPAQIFKTPTQTLEKIEGIGTVRASHIRKFKDFDSVSEEIEFIGKYKIQPLFITDARYPRRLLNCYDAPVLLYYKGEADLNASRIIAVIGTRNHTDYGKKITEDLVAELAPWNVMVVSGLAFGIDAIAHKSALRNELATIGVMAHGLDQVYPYEHTSLAKDMLKSGGLLTEFRSQTTPDKHNFPSRNRIVAGMSDAIVVVETGVKGGSMITAELGNGYNKDVFAFPGRIGDSKSAGCNHLVKMNKASLITSAKDLVESLNWDVVSTSRIQRQRSLFVDLSAEQQLIVNILNEKMPLNIDEINFRSGLSNSATAAAMLELEMKNVVVSLPGKLYRLD